MTPKYSTFFMMIHRSFRKHTQRCETLRYLFAILLCAIGLSVNQFFEHLLHQSFFAVPIFSVMLSAFYGGTGPGILCLLVSAWVTQSNISIYPHFIMFSYLCFGTILTWFSSQLGSILISIDSAREKNSFLMDATKLLNSSLDMPKVIDQFTKALVPRMADTCAIDLLDKKGNFSRISIAHFNEEWEKTVADLVNKQIPQKVSSDFKAEIIHTNSWNKKEDFASIYNQEQLNIFSDLRIHSIMITPLVARNKTLGAISFFSSCPDRQFKNKDLSFAQDLACLATISLDNSQLYSHAQKALQLRENLMAVVAHDLKNPITSIQLNTNLLTKIQTNPEKLDVYCKIILSIQQATGRMNCLITDILDFGKIVAGRLVIDLIPTEMTALIEETVELLRPLAEQKEIQIQLKIETPDQLHYHCDRERISQTLSNLIGNAIKFTPKKGSIEVNLQKKSQELIFSVSDSGPGIDSQSLPYIFDWYWQEKSKKRGGCGLGLSIAKGITEAHGGKIWVENHREKGCSFFFTLPLQSL